MILIKVRFSVPQLFALSIGILLNPWVCTAVQAAQCVQDSRVLKVDANQSVRFNELSCHLERDSAASMRVQFQRLRESAAGVLLNKGKAP